MDTENNFRYSFDSASNCEEASSNNQLNVAMFMSMDEGILSSDESFYDANELPSPIKNVEKKTNESIESGTWQFSHIFENTNTTSLNSLPNASRYSDTENVANCTRRNSQSSFTTEEINLSREQCEKTKKLDYSININLPLKVILKRMFDDILGRRASPEKESNATCCTKTSHNETSLNNVTFPTTAAVDTNNNIPLYRASSTESIKDSSRDDVSSENISTFFVNKFFPKKLVTILENTNENNTTTRYMDDSSNNSGKYIGRVANYIKIEPKHCMVRKIFNATDLENSESSDPSNTYASIAIISKNIIQKANSVESNEYSEKFDSMDAGKESMDISVVSNEGYYYDSSIESKSNSSGASSELDESDYSGMLTPSLRRGTIELSSTKRVELSPIVNKFRRRCIPSIFLTPATPR